MARMTLYYASLNKSQLANASGTRIPVLTTAILTKKLGQEEDSMGNAEVVKHIYDRFAQGDAPAILATFDRDVEFRLAEGHPYSPEGKPWIGGDAITKNFFMKSGPEWDGWSIGIHQLLDMGDVVVVEGRYSGVYKPTGKKLDAQVCHVWRFSGGKIKSFHQYVNTAHLQAIMRREPEKERLAAARAT
jgi:uncharacterized protein